jgi:hypothetical protein
LLCLVVLALLLATSDGGSSPAAGPSSTAGTDFTFLAWNSTAGEWQQEDVNKVTALNQSTTFLVTLHELGGPTHVTVEILCSSQGNVRLNRADVAEPAMTAPGPGRSRPDSTALDGTLVAWNATFIELSWRPNRACLRGQHLAWSATTQGGEAQFIWSMTPPESANSNDGLLSVSVSADDQAEQTIKVGY